MHKDFKIQKTNNKKLMVNHSITNKKLKAKKDLTIQIPMVNLITMQTGVLAMISMLSQQIKTNLKRQVINSMVAISIKMMTIETMKIRFKRVHQETKT